MHARNETTVGRAVREQSRGDGRGAGSEQNMSGSKAVMARSLVGTGPRGAGLIHSQKRGPKRGPNPLSKTVPTGHTASHGARGTRRDETPGPARDFGVWRAKEMVDRGRIELPTPGFSVPWSGDGRRTETAGPGQDSSSISPARIAVSPGGGRACRSSAGGSSRPTSSRSPLQRAAGLVDTCWLFSTADCAGHDLSAWMRAIPGLTTRDQTSRLTARWR